MTLLSAPTIPNYIIVILSSLKLDENSQSSSALSVNYNNNSIINNNICMNNTNRCSISNAESNLVDIICSLFATTNLLTVINESQQLHMNKID